MTVRELGERMDARELNAWMAYAGIEPFGNEWEQTGVIASTIANVNRAPKKRRKPYEPVEFMPVAPAPEPDVAPEFDDESDAAELAKDQRLSAMMQALANRQNQKGQS